MTIGYTKRQAGSLKYRIDKQMSKIETEVAKLGSLVSDHQEGGYPGFGAVTLIRDQDSIWPWPDETHDQEAAHTWQDYEDVAAGDPDHDWCVQIDGPLADYLYQRQGEGVWALVKQGMGFA